MIVEFSVKNFRSIKELQTISFVASGLKSAEENILVDARNIATDGNMRLLKTVGIYGANASGKSNIIKAIEYFLRAVRSEASSESNLGALYDPFLYEERGEDTECFFQLVLIVNQKKFRYGFTVRLNPASQEKSTREMIGSEWLFGTKEKNAGEYFTRKRQEVQTDKLDNEQRIPALPYPHTLFLTHAAAFDREGVCAQIRSFIRSWTISNFGASFENFRFGTIQLIEILRRKEDFLRLLRSFNLYYDDVIIEKDPHKPNFDEIDYEKIFFVKKVAGKDTFVRLNLGLTESAGTQKLFDISGFLLRAFALPIGGFINLDEIDSTFHPALLIRLIGLFNDPSINTNAIQVLFTSYDTNLLSPAILRRDQVYFTEKGEDDATRLYSLADLKGIRNDADFARNYLAGYYGAIPILEQFCQNTPTQVDGTLGK